MSWSTAREALKILEEEHLLLCRHGVGRFVAPGTSGALAEGIPSLQSIALCQRIGVAKSTPWILLEQPNSDPQDRPVRFSKDYHCGDKFRFQVLGRRH